MVWNPIYVAKDINIDKLDYVKIRSKARIIFETKPLLYGAIPS